jgi:IrrE N-terminal-like domain
MGQVELRIREITAAVRGACAEAGLNFDALKPGVVPLYDIISAFPLRVAALPDGKRLTARSALEFLGRETGKELPAPENGDRPLSGFIYVFEYGGFFNGCILTESNDPVERRRFSAAHELAHYLLHFRPVLERRRREGASEPLILTEAVSLDLKDKQEAEPAAHVSATEGVLAPRPLALPSVPAMEREANRFAAELLMPAHACETLSRQYAERFGSMRAVVARLLARDFFVSTEAMTWRLKEMGLYAPA